MMRNRHQSMMVFTLLLIIGPAASAQDAMFGDIVSRFDGHLKQATAVQLDELDRFTTIRNSLELKYSDWLTDAVGLTLVGRAVYDGVFDVEDDLNPQDKEDYGAYLDLREAVLDISAGNMDVHLGRQQVVWGKTDGLRVLDVVNPLDLRDNGASEFLDQRIPLWMANAEVYIGSDFSLQLLLIPDLRFHKLEELPFPEGATVKSTREPETRAKNFEYGARFGGFLNGWDFTLNYLAGWDDVPAVKTVFAPDTRTVTVAPEYERLQIIGGTVANVF